MNLPDPFPRWPPAWVEDHVLATEEVIAEGEGVALAAALRGDDRILLSVTWPTGRRYVLVDPMGAEPAEALRVGEPPAETEDARLVDAAWSQVLTLAKALMDGEAEMPWGQFGQLLGGVGAPPPDEEPPPKRWPWRRG